MQRRRPDFLLLYQSSITSPPPTLWQDFSQFEDFFFRGPPRLIWSRLVRFPAFFFFAHPLHNLIYLDISERNLWPLLLNFLIPILGRGFPEKRTSNVTAFHIKDPKSYLKNWQASSLLAHLLAPHGINKNGKAKWYRWTLSISQTPWREELL